MKQHGGCEFRDGSTRGCAAGAGDRFGCAVWLKIWRAIKVLQSEKPHEGEAVN